MSDTQRTRLRLALTALVLLLELAHLAWEHLNGGIRSHHLLNRADLPAISNVWGLLLLPVLTWLLSGISLRRVTPHSAGETGRMQLPVSLIIGLSGALLFGIALAVAFTSGRQDVAEVLFMGLLLAAVLLPVYRTECLLGFVLGMTFTFGAVLPTLIGLVMVAISALLHRLVYPQLRKLWWWIRTPRQAAGPAGFPPTRD